MTAVLIGEAEPNTEPWYKLRAGGIGASEIAGVVGLSRYMSPFWLWHFKKGNLPGQKVTSAMDWGHRLEGVVAAKFAEDHPEFEVTRTPGTYAHVERDWQRCNPDGLVGDGECFPGALLEVKTCSAFAADGFGKSGSTEIPLDYRCQIQWQLDIFGLPRCYVATLIGGNDYREYVIEADPEDQKTLREAGAAFWASLATNDEPPLDYTDSTYQAVVALNPDLEKDGHVDLPSDLWAAYLKAKSDTTEAEGELQLAKAQILQAMRGVQYARFAGQNVIRRQRSSAGTYYLKEIA